MKRIIAFIVSFLIMIPIAIAENIDLSNLSYDELVELVDRAQRQIMFSDYWQEVEVPIGRYIVGKDIPAGIWTVSAKSKTYTVVDQERERSDGHIGSLSEKVCSFQLYAKDFIGYSESYPTSASLELQEGDIFKVKQGTAVFTPYKGLGFKFKN